MANPRGSRPDAEVGNDLYLFKYVARLRLTYQIRVLTFAAAQRSGRLIIRTAPGCVLSEELARFIASNPSAVILQEADE